MRALTVPTIPNSPLNTKDEKQIFGKLRLRHNSILNFVENAEFDPKLAVYDDNYQNSQAHSARFLNHMKSILELLKSHLAKNSTLVEVGCGKGDFMELLEEDGYFNVSGYDATYEGKNPKIHRRYLTANDRIKADLVVLRHVLEHIGQPHKFLQMLKEIFGNAKIYVEVPDYDWIIENEAFFDITYEHVNYFSRNSLASLFANHKISNGLCFSDQYQYIIANLQSASVEFGQIYDGKNWQDLDFETLFPNLRKKILDIEKQLKNGDKAYLWGAATKGCMFLVHCAGQNKLVDKVAFAVDSNPGKCDKFLPGTLVPIKSKEYFFKHAKANDLLIISNPNYFDEIKKEVVAAGLGDLRIVCL